MSYIGNQPPDIGAYDFESFDGGGTSFTLKRSATVSSVLLFIDGVRQTPTDAYTVSGVTLTTTATTPSGTDNVTVMFMGDVVDIGAPSADTVSTAKIQDDAVTTDKILDDAVTADKLANSINTEITANTAKVTNATHTGDVTGATALTIATDAVDIAMLSATGTADATTFLRGDNAWAAAGGDNTPSFMAYYSGAVSIANATTTAAILDSEYWDTDSAYNVSDGKFTVPVGGAGKYMFTGSTEYAGLTIHDSIAILLLKNGSSVGGSWQQYGASRGGGNTLSVTYPLDLAEADYIQLGLYQNSGGAKNAAANTTYLTGYKMIGV